MFEIGKSLVLFGLLIAFTGAAVWCFGRGGFRGLPGDIYHETERVRVYIPIVTCLVLSALLTGLLRLWQWLDRR